MLSSVECAPILPAGTGVPALSTDEVASVGPLDRVATALTQSELSRTAAVSPPGVEVAVVSTLSTGGALTLGESCVSINLVGKEVERGGQHRSSGHQGAEERLERDHDEGCKTRIDLRTVFVGFDDSTFPSSASCFLYPFSSTQVRDIID